MVALEWWPLLLYGAGYNIFYAYVVIKIITKTAIFQLHFVRLNMIMFRLLMNVLFTIGPQAVRRHKLSGTAGMVIDQYNKFLNPGTLVSFTSAAFRIFHSTIPPTVK